MCLCPQWRETTVQTCRKTAVSLQVHFLDVGIPVVVLRQVPAVVADSWRCLRFVHRHGVRRLRRGSFFWVLHIRCRTGGSRPQGHAAHNLLHVCSDMDKHIVVSVTSAPPPPQPPPGGQPNPSYPAPMSSGHHISMEHPTTEERSIVKL